MARILFLTELLPYPLVSGAKIRAYYVLRQLSQRHEITLLSFVRPDDQPEFAEHLGTFLDNVRLEPIKRSLLRDARAGLVSLFTGKPAIVAREDIASMVRATRELLATGQYDLVHADQIPMAYYSLQRRDLPARRLLDQHNATYRILERMARVERSWWKRAFLHREARAFYRYEHRVCRAFDHVTFVTEEDRQEFQAHVGDDPLEGRTTVIPICVDTDENQPVAPVREPFRVTHVGTMYWPPNVEGILWFWENVWPLVREQIPHARLTLIGKRPPESLRKLGETPQVDVPGFVEDLDPYLAETAAFVVPLLSAGGMRVKIVDAWCWGLPIVSTSVGAEGIATRNGANILIGDTPEEFAGAISKLFSDSALQRVLRENGRRWVEERYSWRRVYTAWDDVYDRVLGSPSAVRR